MAGGSRLAAPVPEKLPAMRLLAIGLAIAVVVFVVTGGHVVFLPLLFLPIGLFGLGHTRRDRSRWS